jgi:hypothetical protein
MCAAILYSVTTTAGQFKRITIDGSFEDWAGVAPAAVDPEDASGQFDFKEVYIANDDQYLYVRVKLYAPADYGAFHHHVLIDADANTATGSPRLGVGSELMIEDGFGYQQKNGGFNEGGASGLDWAEAPTGQLTEFEARISRNVKDAEGLLVLTNNSIILAFEAQDRNWATVDSAPDTGGVPYDFAPTPAKATGTQTLVSLANTPWRYNDTGADLGSDWLAADYDDTQAGWKSGSGLFGFGVTAGTYPSAVQSPLASGHTTYYLRVPFTWNFDAFGIALAVDNYLSDGAVIYLNGAEVKRVRIADGPVSASTPATGGPALAGKVETFTLPPAGLIVGNNVLEVELHQAVATPTDLAFGLKLVATDSLPPSIEDPSQPADRSVVEGNSTTFAVGNVLGTVPFFYQWFKDGAPIDAATNATLTIPMVLVTDAGQYRIEINNSTGAKATSRNAVLTTTAVSVSITNNAEPADRTIAEGESTTFTLAVAGSPILNYQWFKNDAPIDGATAAAYTITNAVLSDAGNYSVSVSNRMNVVTSREAKLTVVRDLVPPTITQLSGSATKVTVQFSEPLDPASANTAANYALTGGAQVQSAVLDLSDSRTVALTTTPLSFGTNYTLSVKGVKDRFNNPATTTAPFRATILIDGSFDDWAGIASLDTETQDTPEGKEFKDIYVANDDDYLFIRFSFYANIGQLPVDAYFHIFSDTDNDPATGYAAAGVGSEMMIENGSGYQEKNGQFNEGGVSNLDFAIGPQAPSAEFECRISRKTTYANDGLPVYTGDTIALAFQLISTTWTPLDTAPASGGLVYTFTKLAPLNPGPLHVQLSGGQVSISWTGSGVLQATDSLSSSNWAPVSNPASPYLVSPSGQQRYFRLTQ